MKRFDEHTPGAATSGVDSEPLEELLGHARRDVFTPKETDEIWSRLGVVLGVPSNGGGSSSPAGGSTSGAGSVWSAKTIAMLAFGGAVIVAGGLAAMRIAGSAWHHAGQAPSSGSLVGTADDRHLPSTIENGSVGGAQVEPVAVAPIAESPLSLEPSLVSPPKRTDPLLRSPGPRRVALRAGQPRASVNAVEGATEATPPAPPSPSSDPGLNEGALLLRARRELGSNPTETLKLTEQHVRLWPTGTLAPEREVLAIEALVQLGRLPEARARFADFRAHFPQSPHLARLEAILGR